MKTYLALIQPGDECRAHGVTFPDLPGVHSAADDENDILPKAIEALQLWAEDMDMPEPSDMATVTSLKEVRERLNAGHYLIAIPFIENDTAVVRANVTFERGLLRAIDTAAKGRSLTRSAFLACAARREIEGAH